MAKIVVLISVMCWTACAGGPPRLRPAARATASAAAPGAVRAAEDGVELIAQVNAWPGDPQLAREVIPIRVWIRNGGPADVRLRLDDVMLVAADGSRSAALPPIGPVHLARGVVPTVQEPSFEAAGFMVAPHLAYAYPTLQAYQGPYDYETGYFLRYRDAAEARVREHPEALRLGIPEGVVKSGGRIEGYLYFEPVEASDADKGLVRLQADLETTEEAELSVLSIPFVLADE
jgi:hypothetical protein